MVNKIKKNILFMNVLIPFIISLFLLCSFKVNNAMPNMYDIHFKCVSDDAKELKTYELFASSQRDTSAYSFLLIENKMFTFLRICLSTDTKDFLHDPYSERGYKIVPYKDMMNELSECISYLSTRHDITKIKYLTFHLFDMGDIAVEATKNYNNSHPHRKKYESEEIIKAVSETSLTNDLNSIFNKYGIEIGQIECEEYIVFLVKRDLFLKKARIEHETDIPPKIIDLPISVELKKIE